MPDDLSPSKPQRRKPRRVHREKASPDELREITELRKALRQVHRWLRVKKIFEALEKYDAPPWSPQGYYDFLSGESGLGTHRVESLRRFLFGTIGLGLIEEGGQLDDEPDLFGALRRHALVWGSRFKRGGQYFLYHGSHWRSGHYVVRLVTLTQKEPNGTIHVLDELDDDKTEQKGRHKASGSAINFDDSLHITTYQIDNSKGVRLVVLDHIHATNGTMSGRMLGLTKQQQRFDRAVLMKRVPEGDGPANGLPKDKGTTGIFTPKALAARKMKFHRLAFDELASLNQSEPFEDPMTTWIKAPATATNKAPKTSRETEPNKENS